MKQHYQQPHPIVAGVGGSIGSTLSLLLLYPLERVRIEMQATTAAELCASDQMKEEPEGTDNIDFAIPPTSTFTSEDLYVDQSDDISDEGEFNKDLDDEIYNSIPSVRETMNNNEHDTSMCIGKSVGNQTTKFQSAVKRYRMWSTIISLYQRQELYKGASPVAITLAVSNFIFFYALQASRKLLILMGQERNTPTSTLLGMLDMWNHSHFMIVL